MKSISPTSFGLTQHKMQQFSASVPSAVTAMNITDPSLWANIAPQCRSGDMIWVDAEDFSFTARLKVTFSAGQELRTVLLEFKQLEVIDTAKLEDDSASHFITMRGTKKWCIVERATAEIRREMIPTKLEAQKELDDYLRALAA